MTTIQEEIEDKIIDCIVAGAGGRLVAFKPEKSDKDLVVEKKGDYESKKISLKIYGKELLDSEKIKEEVKPEKDFYLLFVYFDFVKQELGDDFWIVSTENKFSKTLINKKDFGIFLIDKLGKEFK